MEWQFNDIINIKGRPINTILLAYIYIHSATYKDSAVINSYLPPVP